MHRKKVEIQNKIPATFHSHHLYTCSMDERDVIPVHAMGGFAFSSVGRRVIPNYWRVSLSDLCVSAVLQYFTVSMHDLLKSI